MPYPSPSPSPSPDAIVITTKAALRAIIADEVDRAVRRAVVSLMEDAGRDDDWITPKTAVKVYGRHRSTLARWSQAGLLPTRKIAGSVYYSRGAIARMSGQADV